MTKTEFELEIEAVSRGGRGTTCFINYSYITLAITFVFDTVYASARRCGCSPSLSIIYCGIQSVGLMGLRPEYPKRERPPMPKSVWNMSGMLPVRSEKPPVSVSWQERMNCCSFSELIQCKRPIMVSEESTHQE